MSIKYIVDESGNRTGVFLSLEEYEELLERAEDAEALEMLRKMRENPIKTRSFGDFVDEYSRQ